MSAEKPAIRLIATDLDGTLLRNDGTVSPRTRQALTRAREAGLHVVLVSARPPRVLRLMAEQVGVSGLAIGCNGAITYDLAAEAIVQHTPIASPAAQRLVMDLRAHVPGVIFAVELGLRFGCEPAWAAWRPAAAADGALVADALALCTSPVTKLIAHHPEHTADALLERIRPVVGDGLGLTHSGAPYVEVSAAEVGKAWALAALCADLGVAPAEVVAFGDMPNDLPMLRWAGLGVAVANAHPSVLAEARFVTRANSDDGVAVLVEQLLSERAAPADELLSS